MLFSRDSVFVLDAILIYAKSQMVEDKPRILGSRLLLKVVVD
jgi:hypothetical protein